MNRSEFKQKILKITRDEDPELLKDYANQIRVNLEKSTQRFYTLHISVLASIGLHHLAFSEKSNELKIGPISVPTSEYFLDLYLLFTAALFSAACTMGYLRRFLREVYDYLMVFRYKALGATGLHELRLPPNYVLGTELLYRDSGRFERLCGRMLASLQAILFVGIPIAYLFITSGNSIPMRLAQESYLGVFIILAVLLVLLLGLSVIYLSSRLEFPAE